MAAGALALTLAHTGATFGQNADLDHPAAWGDTHVGDPMPRYGDAADCFFCHRQDVRSSWPTNSHQRSVRQADPEQEPLKSVRERFLSAGLVLGVQAVLGSDRVMKFLRAEEGQENSYSLLSATWEKGNEPGGRLVDVEGAHWDESAYARRCAGCHSTAVSSPDGTFAEPSIECFSCHGVVESGHASDPASALLSHKWPGPASVEISICGQCHVRGGRSASTGRAFPNQFVPGDNLFRDFVFDLSDEALAAKNPADRHVLENVREVAVFGVQRRHA